MSRMIEAALFSRNLRFLKQPIEAAETSKPSQIPSCPGYIPPRGKITRAQYCQRRIRTLPEPADVVVGLGGRLNVQARTG
jgi:hypothetical protein